MKVLISLAMTTMFLNAACGRVQESGAAAHTSSSGGPMMVCSTNDLPAGWVVTAHSRSASCGSLDWTSIDYWNQYTIEQPGESATVCDDSPIPAGYVKKSSVRSIPCVIPMFTSIDYTNAYVIEKL